MVRTNRPMTNAMTITIIMDIPGTEIISLHIYQLQQLQNFVQYRMGLIIVSGHF